MCKTNAVVKKEKERKKNTLNIENFGSLDWFKQQNYLVKFRKRLLDYSFTGTQIYFYCVKVLCLTPLLCLDLRLFWDFFSSAG